MGACSSPPSAGSSVTTTAVPLTGLPHDRQVVLRRYFRVPILGFSGSRSFLAHKPVRTSAPPVREVTVGAVASSSIPRVGAKVVQQNRQPPDRLGVVGKIEDELLSPADASQVGVIVVTPPAFAVGVVCRCLGKTTSAVANSK